MSVAASMGLALLLVVETVVPWADRYQNMRGFGATIRTVVPAGAALGAVRQKRDGWVFYSGRFVEPLDTHDAVRAFMDTPGPRWLISDGETLRAVWPALPDGLRSEASARVADDQFWILHGGGP